MIYLYLLLINFSFTVFVKGQSIFKCSPSTGALDTFSFNQGANNGVACITRRKKNTKTITMYMDILKANGNRKIGVAAASYDQSLRAYVGNMYRLYPPGPKTPFTLTVSPGYVKMKFENNHIIEMVQKPKGIAWVPADIRVINGCATESPQLYMDVMDQVTTQHSKMMMCAMSSQPESGFNAVYGFGMRMSQTIGMEPFFYLGKTNSPIYTSGPINIKAKLSEVCLHPDCKLCGPGYRSLTLSN